MPGTSRTRFAPPRPNAPVKFELIIYLPCHGEHKSVGHCDSDSDTRCAFVRRLGHSHTFPLTRKHMSLFLRQATVE